MKCFVIWPFYFTSMVCKGCADFLLFCASADGREHWPKLSLEVAGLILAMAIIGYVKGILVLCNRSWLDMLQFIFGIGQDTF